MSSNENPHDHQPAALTPPSPGASLPRRRLIQFGAVPVALTLVSRPSFADTQCNTTSAWGSAILRNGVASSRARALAARINSPSWTLSQIISDSPGAHMSKPWHAIHDARYAGIHHPGQSKTEYAQATLTIGNLYGGGISGYGGSLTAPVHAFLTANPSTTNFTSALLVARINAVYGSAGAAQCLASTPSADILAQMATGSFVPSNGGTPWTSNDILQYLLQNNFVA